MMSKAKERQPAVQIRGDLKQRDVRALEIALIDIPRPSGLLGIGAASIYMEAMLKAAIAAGWVDEPECRMREVIENGKRLIEYYFGDTLVDDLPPNVCYRAGAIISQLYNEFTNLDPN